MKKRKNESITLVLAGVVLFFTFSILQLLNLLDLKANKVGVAQAIEIIISFLLVTITAFYVKRTAEIADATKEQAEASVEMAEEMKEQRYSESLPIIVPDIIPEWSTQGLELNEVPYVYLQTGVGIKVVWWNFGRGVAINLQFSFWAAPQDSGKVKFFPPRESETLSVGDKKEIDFQDRLGGQLLDIPEKYHPHLKAEYQDIHKRKITTVQEFRIVGKNQHKRAFTGELYFTINGIRLGREVTQND